MRKINKWILLGIGILCVFVIIIVANFFTGGTNDFLNKALNPVDYSCSSDSDCVKKGTDCGKRCGWECINKNWKLSCPFPEPTIACTLIPDPNIECRCIDNTCVNYNTFLNQTVESRG